MTYRKIFDLKFGKKVSTFQLQRYFPNESSKICKIALMELPAKTLRKLCLDRKTADQVLQLKRELRRRAHPS